MCGRVWVSYWCGMRTVSTVLGAGSTVDTKIRVLESFLTLNLHLSPTQLQGWDTHRVTNFRGPLHGRSDRRRPHRPADDFCALRLRVSRARSRDQATSGSPSAAPRPPAGRPAWCNELWHQHGCQLGRRGARRAACGRMCSFSWLCAVGHRSAVLRRERLRCCSACLLRVMGCSCSRDGLLSTVAHAVQIAAQSCRELCRTHAEHVGDAGSWVC